MISLVLAYAFHSAERICALKRVSDREKVYTFWPKL